MGKKRAERVRGQENHLAQILNEPNERPSQRVKKSSEHLPLCLDTQRLRFCFWAKLCRNCADETRIEHELAKDRAGLAEGDGGLIELEINQILVAIDFVTQAGNGRELMVELQDLVQIAKTGGVNFQFEHLPSNYERRTLMQKETRDCAGRRAE